MKDLQDIKKEMTDRFVSDSIVVDKYELVPGQDFDAQFSKVSIENILFDVIAYALWVFYNLLELYKSDINEVISESRIHTQKWFRAKALEYMHGYALNDSDKYDTTGLTDQEIASAKLIANAAPVKMRGFLRMKVVKMVANELAPLSPAELSSFGTYMNYVTDAGTYVVATSNEADDLKLTLDVYYDNLVMAGDGSRLDGTSSTPVLDAIHDYLKSLRFNGSFIESKLEKEIETVEGVTMVKVVGAWSKYGSYSYDSVNNPNVGVINEIRVADAGYMRLDEGNSIINFKVFSDYE